MSAGRIFTDNGNYLVNGAQTLTQRPLLRLEEHLSRNVTDALWFSADAFYNLGGQRRASMGSSRTTWRIRFGSEREWDFAYGAAPI